MIRKNIIALLILFSFFLTDIGLSEEGNNFSIERDEPYEIYCTEYCGKSHSKMLARVYITEVQNE